MYIDFQIYQVGGREGYIIRGCSRRNVGRYKEFFYCWGLLLLRIDFIFQQVILEGLYNKEFQVFQRIGKGKYCRFRICEILFLRGVGIRVSIVFLELCGQDQCLDFISVISFRQSFVNVSLWGICLWFLGNGVV